MCTAWGRCTEKGPSTVQNLSTMQGQCIGGPLTYGVWFLFTSCSRAWIDGYFGLLGSHG
ncbi:hypothetical protein SLEP1_g5235 [Rubroshorea leprosula]|uniref:Uncharacterized protein n=1 Tax=Rubroshorea leprosula TaxID=152421 RepID=A0AAV5HX61_9ROSI|nr:hypothetical protein SLEP1_g5235 [Rubroshorea leprosula]